MKNYVKPMIMLNEELAEGVFAASGDLFSDCMTVDFQIGDPSNPRNEGINGNTATKVTAKFQYNHIGYDHCNSGCHIRAVFPCDVNVVEVTSGVTMTGNGSNVIDFFNPNPLHAAKPNADGSSNERSTIVFTAEIPYGMAALFYAGTTASITDADNRVYDCSSHSHMYN